MLQYRVPAPVRRTTRWVTRSQSVWSSPYRARHDREPALGHYIERHALVQSGTKVWYLRTRALTTSRGSVVAVSYPATCPIEDLEGASIVQVLSWRNGGWSPTATFPDVLLPGQLAYLRLTHGTVSFSVTEVPGAGDNWTGAVISDFGGPWHLIPFDWHGKLTTYVRDPTFDGGGTVQVGYHFWGCEKLRPYTFRPAIGEFVPSGSVREQGPVAAHCDFASEPNP